MVKNEGKKLTCGMENNMVTKGYMEHMKRVNKGLEYMYPNRGKGSNRKNLPENPIVSHICVGMRLGDAASETTAWRGNPAGRKKKALVRNRSLPGGRNGTVPIYNSEQSR